jgi:hypothetical protein
MNLISIYKNNKKNYLNALPGRVKTNVYLVNYFRYLKLKKKDIGLEEFKKHDTNTIESESIKTTNFRLSFTSINKSIRNINNEVILVKKDKKKPLDPITNCSSVKAKDLREKLDEKFNELRAKMNKLDSNIKYIDIVPKVFIPPFNKSPYFNNQLDTTKSKNETPKLKRYSSLSINLISKCSSPKPTPLPPPNSSTFTDPQSEIQPKPQLLTTKLTVKGSSMKKSDFKIINNGVKLERPKLNPIDSKISVNSKNKPKNNNNGEIKKIINNSKNSFEHNEDLLEPSLTKFKGLYTSAVHSTSLLTQPNSSSKVKYFCCLDDSKKTEPSLKCKNNKKKMIVNVNEFISNERKVILIQRKISNRLNEQKRLLQINYNNKINIENSESKENNMINDLNKKYKFFERNKTVAYLKNKMNNNKNLRTNNPVSNINNRNNNIVCSKIMKKEVNEEDSSDDDDYEQVYVDFEEEMILNS